MISLNGQNDNMMTIQHQAWWRERVSHAHKHTHTLNEWKMISSNQDVIPNTLIQYLIHSRTDWIVLFCSITQHTLTHTQTGRRRDTVVAFYPLCVFCTQHVGIWHSTRDENIRNFPEFNAHTYTHTESKSDREAEVLVKHFFHIFWALHIQR